MIEFLGGDSIESATCEYLTAGDKNDCHHREPRRVTDLPTLWENQLEISRSLWDRESLLLHLDIDYVNFDNPIKAYLDPERTFALQRPVELAVEAVLLDYGIKPLHLLSGRGHHFVWRISRDSSAFSRLVELGRVPPSLAKLNAQPHRPNSSAISPALGRAFGGLGLVMEYLAHRIKLEAVISSGLPVELTAIEVGPGQCWREMISIDISEYGDPLGVRVIRVPFSLYLKPAQQRHTLGKAQVRGLRPIFLVPLRGIDSSQGISLMHNSDAVTQLARQNAVAIPEASESVQDLIDSYENSSLKRFHDFFYSQEPEPPENWPQTYDQTPLDAIPLCARRILEHPNDLLLKPAGVARVVRVMLALGWHPRHIAGLIRSKFERNYNWGQQWAGYDPAFRAEFYTRLFGGLFVTGVDNLVDFNCQSAKEERFCFIPDCRFNLEDYKNSLLDRRKYERLARRPFNRLFLPAEHL